MQFAEGAGQVCFDCLGGDEQALGDLPVGQARTGQVGDAQLAGSQGIAAAGRRPPGTGAGGEQFGQRAVLQGAGAALVGQGQAFLERIPGGGPAVGAAFGRAQLDQRQRQLQAAG